MPSMCVSFEATSVLQQAELGEVRSVDADRDLVAGPGKDLVDSFVQVRLDVAEHAGVAVGDRFDLLERRGVVGLRIDADPVLAELDAGDLLAEQRLADVGSEIADARDRPQVPARGEDDAVLLGQ